MASSEVAVVAQNFTAMDNGGEVISSPAVAFIGQNFLLWIERQKSWAWRLQS